MTENELLFRILLLLLFLTLVGLWAQRLIRDGITRATFFTREEGFWNGFLIRALLSASTVGISVYLVSPSYMVWSHVSFPIWLRLVGLPVCIIAIALFFSAQKHLGSAFSPTLTIKPDQVLVTSGPYKWVRHPMYIAFLLSWVGYFLLSANWFIGLTGVAAECIIMFLRTPREELILIANFRNDYRNYMQDVGRFFPRWRPVSEHLDADRGMLLPSGTEGSSRMWKEGEKSVTNRTNKLLIISKRLVIVIFLSLLATVLLFGVTISFGIRFMMSWFCFECGTIGGFVSIQQRLKSTDNEELSLLSGSWTAVIVKPLYGGLFALILYSLFLSGLLEGQLFPAFSVHTFDNPPTTENIKRFFVETYPKTAADFAKFAFWSFVAGFSERFVPGIIQRFTPKEP